MGLFDAIKQKASAAFNDCKDTYEQAKTMDVRAICAAMKEAEGMTLAGYNMALREKCEEMDNAGLKELYYEITRAKRGAFKMEFKLDLNPFSKNLVKAHPAADTIGSVLVERHVFTRDENGRIRDH